MFLLAWGNCRGGGCDCSGKSLLKNLYGNEEISSVRCSFDRGCYGVRSVESVLRMPLGSAVMVRSLGYRLLVRRWTWRRLAVRFVGARERKRRWELHIT